MFLAHHDSMAEACSLQVRSTVTAWKPVGKAARAITCCGSMLVSIETLSSFSVLVLVVWRQEGHRGCINLCTTIPKHLLLGSA